MRFDVKVAMCVAAVIVVGGTTPPLAAQSVAMAEPLVAEGATAGQADPADSLYRAGQFYLRRNEFRSAAAYFRAVPERFPRSRRVPEALYWEAFALYRVGGRDNYRAALASLNRSVAEHPRASIRAEADALLARIHGELARLGDPESVRFVRDHAGGTGSGSGEGRGTGKGEKVVKDDKEAKEAKDASKGSGSSRSAACERNADDDMRIAALNALMQMEDEQAIPILREVLKKRGGCSEVLRRKAVFIVAQTSSEATADILLDVASSDPDPGIRKEAVRWMSEVKSERVVPVLDSVLRTTPEPALRDAAMFALSEHGSPRARQSLRRYAEAADTPEDGRLKAITYIGLHSGKPEDAEFLAGLYPKLTSAKARSAVMHAMGEIETRASWDFLQRVAVDSREDLSVRKDALFWLEEADGPTAELIALESKLDQPRLREHFVFVLSERNDEAATDRLIAIAKSHEDRELRKKALFWLGQKRDPRVRQLLLDIINQ